MTFSVQIHNLYTYFSYLFRKFLIDQIRMASAVILHLWLKLRYASCLRVMKCDPDPLQQSQSRSGDT